MNTDVFTSNCSQAKTATVATQSSKRPSEKTQGAVGAEEAAPKPALEDQQILPENDIQDTTSKINRRNPRLNAGGRG